MKRIEIIPYKDKAFKSVSDLGNCFYIEHFNIGCYANTRV